LDIDFQSQLILGSIYCMPMEKTGKLRLSTESTIKILDPLNISKCEKRDILMFSIPNIVGVFFR
jgi:hypothetical protein